MSNQIPGSGLLGFGFNILGPYSDNQVIKQIFKHINLAASSFTYAPTKITYDVPDNTTPLEDTHNDGTAYTFSNKQEIQRHFASSLHASLGASWGLSSFSGQFDSSFSQDQTSIQSHTYGIYEDNFRAWRLALDSTDPMWLADDFVQQANALPSTFTPDTQAQFFQFFGNWGTHYINEVTLGGRLYYYVTVDDSFSSESTDTAKQISLEYKAAFIDVKGSAGSDWSKLDENWLSSRSVSYSTDGGDTSLSGSIVNSEDNFNKDYVAWNTAVEANPAGIEFKLRPISTLFLGAQEDAVADALQAYTSSAIAIAASFEATVPSGNLVLSNNASQTLLGGKDITPPPPALPPTYPNGFPAVGFNLTILDGITLDEILNNSYYLPAWPDPNDPAPTTTVYDTMYADVQDITQSDYIVVFTGTAIPELLYPTGPFANWLNSCGAKWADWLASAQSFAGRGTEFFGNYVCVGQQGIGITQQGTASEYWIDLFTVSSFPATITANMFVVLYPPSDAGIPYHIVSPYTSSSVPDEAVGRQERRPALDYLASVK